MYLVKQALDILMPALPRRLPLGENKIPIWIRYTKKILVEEGHISAELNTISSSFWSGMLNIVL